MACYHRYNNIQGNLVVLLFTWLKVMAILVDIGAHRALVEKLQLRNKLRDTRGHVPASLVSIHVETTKYNV